MNSIIDLMTGKHKGAMRLIGFERQFFDRFKGGEPVNLSQYRDLLNEDFRREESGGSFRLRLMRVEPTHEGNYMIDVYDSRKINSPALPPNLRARNTYANPAEALKIYEELRRKLPNLD